MKLKKWENPNLTSLNVESTEICTYDAPHHWHCMKCNKKVISPLIKPGPPETYHCPDPLCDAELVNIGCGAHPS